MTRTGAHMTYAGWQGNPRNQQVIEVDEGGVTRLVAGRCTSCGATFFPPPDVCAGCLGERLTRFHLSREGILYSYTSVEAVSPNRPQPYLLGYVDFPDGVRVLGRIRALIADLRLDMEMEVQHERSGNGSETWQYVFVPRLEE